MRSSCEGHTSEDESESQKRKWTVHLNELHQVIKTDALIFFNQSSVQLSSQAVSFPPCTTTVIKQFRSQGCITKLKCVNSFVLHKHRSYVQLFICINTKCIFLFFFFCVWLNVNVKAAARRRWWYGRHLRIKNVRQLGKHRRSALTPCEFRASIM